MNHIKSIHIEGFKKFRTLDFFFNEHTNILVGENEAGKSTILEALRIVFNQTYKNADKSILKELFNQDAVNDFTERKCVDALPQILIEVQLELDHAGQFSEQYWGLNYHNMRNNTEAFGIKFECTIEAELLPMLASEIAQGNLPYDYYSFKWSTFAGLPYTSLRSPLGLISIDISETETNTSFNYFNRTLFTRKYTDAQRIQAKHRFRVSLENAANAMDLTPIDESRCFGINEKKVPLETVLTVFENGIPLENKGKGMESLIKTRIALDRASNKLDVILLEEPENHLCHANMQKMLHEIEAKQSGAQIILTTHNDLIASRLGLNNVLWIDKESIRSFKDVNPQVATFFMKAADNGFLQFLLSHKVILVEGPTEMLLLPLFYRQITGRTLEEDEVSIISCNGISYKNYLTIAEFSSKRVAVITDNDGKQKSIDGATTYNSSHELQHIFMNTDVSNWTWEVCMYNQNTAMLESMIELEDGAEYHYHRRDVGNRYIGKMLNNKVEIAYQMVVSGNVFTPPDYVKEAIEWLNA